MAEPTKRFRSQQIQQSPYVEGSIARIALENFLTYDGVEFRPGPYLNVIIGPNGTGKSTVVCAICLGLAGKPSFLGRALQPMEYIKHGCDRAMIEIELFNPLGENYIIRRDIYKDNTSKWNVNGRNATQRNVEVIVNKLNIQIGNLCQFLPQDKVSDFAKMTQQELLENTEKAIGPPEMYEQHQKLKNAREKERELELSLQRVEKELEGEIAQNARLEQDVKNYQERERHIKIIDQLKLKRPWVEYEEKRKEYQAAKELKQSLMTKVQEARSQNAPLMKKLEATQKRIKEIDANIKNLAESVKTQTKSAAECHRNIEIQSDQVQELQDDLMTKRQDEMTRKKRVCDLNGQIHSLEADLALLEDRDLQPQIDHVDKQMLDLNRHMSQINHKLETTKTKYNTAKQELVEYNLELKEVLDIGNRRMEKLRQLHKDTYDAVQWLRANKHLFSGTVYEPMMLLLNVKDPNKAKYLENTISANDMRAFVCENSSDMKIFLESVRNKKKLRVNAIIAPSDPVSSFQAKQPITQLRSYGFYTYLRDLFECPEMVMRYLCKNYHIHRIPIGTDYTKACVDEVIKANLGLQNFYTENHKYTVKKSKYSSVFSVRCLELRQPMILEMNFNIAKERELRSEIENKQAYIKKLDTEWHDLDKKYNEMVILMDSLRNEKKELTNKKNMKRQLLQKINMKKDMLKRIESEAVDLDEEERITKVKISVILSQKHKLINELKMHTQKCLKLSEERVRQGFFYTSCHSEHQALSEQLQQQSSTLKCLEHDLEKQKGVSQKLHETAMNLLEVAKKAINLGKNLEIPPDIEKIFKTLPSTLEGIDAAIHEEQARADCTFQTDYSIVEEFQRREKKIEHLREELDKRKDELQSHRRQIETIRNEWLTPLQQLISKINEKFSYFFTCMKCAGEVDLNIPDNPEDYEKYGIRIKVLFRDSEQLRELTSHHQSGGERSVSTVLYMMALQELTSVPFRCVDEINQGMDTQNERKVFELVVKTVCDTKSSQYFLITPKLLQDLTYSDNMTVLCVFNGEHIMNHTEFKISKFLRRRKRLEQ